MRYYVVDAFTEEVFGGNPAGVCVLDDWIEREKMQKIAAENNLSETAFVVKKGTYYELKWFTPAAEIDLCGHATLGTSYVISHFVDVNVTKMEFHTKSGILTVERKGDLFEMDLPLRKPDEIDLLKEVEEIIGFEPKGTYLSRDLVVLLEKEEQVKAVTPDFAKMLELEEGLGFVVTAKGEKVDFVSRFFAPKLGVNEDPVTGSSHSSLIPFWAELLGKDKLTATQLSPRGGILYCENGKDRVKVSGKAVLYMTGELLV